MSRPTLTFHAFLAISLDGFIAREDGSVNFPDDAITGKTLPDGEDCGISAFMSSVDAIVMGRTSYEQVLGFKLEGQGWQYGDTPLFVLTSSLDTLPEGSPESARLLKPGRGLKDHADELNSADSLAFVVEALEKYFGVGDGKVEKKKIYVDGGIVVRQFINKGLLSEITTTIVPILIGSGIRLFGPLKNDVKLDLVEYKSWDVGFMQARYRLRYSDSTV